MPIFAGLEKLLHRHARAGAALTGDEGFIGKL
jgi:hypothetical protein